MSTDVYSIVTERMIALLQSGVAPWRKTWCGGDCPRNLISKKQYRGVNLLLLGSTSFASPYWLTFNQVQQLGGRVCRGATSELVIFWKVFDEANSTNRKEARDARTLKRIPMLRYYRVFNVEQTEGLEEHIPQQNTAQPFTPIECAARIVEGMPQQPPICHDEPRAFYSPVRDCVNLPKPETFDAPADYYAVAFHELTHATGHQTRLNRAGVAGSHALAPYGSADYSREELIAELGGAFLCAEAGIGSTLDNSAAYLQGWLDVLKADSRLIVTAASAAQRAADFITVRNEQQDTEGGTRE